MLTVGFDLDQTLVDSQPRVEASIRTAFTELGGPVDAVDMSALLGLPLETIGTTLWPQVDLDRFVPSYRRAYDEDHGGSTPATPGARAALEAVHAAGGRVVVVSAKYPPAVRVALTEAGLADLVDVIHGDHFGDAKADALRAEQCTVYVGDHTADIRAGLLAGALAVGVTSGSYDAAALTDAGANAVLGSLAEFPAWMDRLRPDPRP